MTSNEVLELLALCVGVPLVLAGIPLSIWVLRGAVRPGRLSDVGGVVAQTEADGTVPPE